MGKNIEKQKKWSIPWVLILIIFFVAVFFATSLFLLLVNQNIVIDKKSIDLLDMYIRSGFVLIGSTLSGIVALFIFSLQEKSKQKEKNENELGHYENIKEEFEDNLKVLDKITDMINQSTIAELAEDIVEEDEMKEILLSVYTQLNFTFYEDFLKELKKKSYGNHVKAFKLSFQIYKYLDLIINKLDNKDNVEKILKLIKKDLAHLKYLYFGPSKPEENQEK
ncbi:hypothetical protein COD71_23550 [Bacillus cereus]|nr:hypothetical protein COD71_23550 [Bacillus cereus]